MYKLNRFKRSFKVSSVQHLRVKNINFVLLNSVAFEGDNCNMCKEAEALVKQVARNISCQENVRAHSMILTYWPFANMYFGLEAHLFMFSYSMTIPSNAAQLLKTLNIQHQLFCRF